MKKDRTDLMIFIPHHRQNRLHLRRHPISSFFHPHHPFTKSIENIYCIINNNENYTNNLFNHNQSPCKLLFNNLKVIML